MFYTLLRHSRGCLYSERPPSDLFFLHRSPHPKTQVQSQTSSLYSKTRLQIHTLKPSPTTSKLRRNGSITKGICSKRGSGGTHPTTNYSQRETIKEQVSEPSKQACACQGPRRAAGTLNSFQDLGSSSLEYHTNRQPENPHQLPHYRLPSVNIASAPTAITVLPSASRQSSPLPWLWKTQP